MLTKKQSYKVNRRYSAGAAISPTVAIAIVLFAHTVAPRDGSVPAVRADASAASKRAHLPGEFWPRALQNSARRPAVRHPFDRARRKNRNLQFIESPETRRILRNRRDGMARRNKTPLLIPRRWATRSKACRQLPPGKYSIPGLLHKYETFHRTTGPVVKLPMDRGGGPAVEQGTRKSLQHTTRDFDRSQPEFRKCDPRSPRQGHPAHC